MKNLLTFTFIYIYNSSFGCFCSSLKPFSEKVLENYKFVALIHIKEKTSFISNSTSKSISFVDTGKREILDYDLLEVFKGQKIDTLFEIGVGTSCDLGVRKGDTWLVFVREYKGKHFIESCDYNSKVDFFGPYKEGSFSFYGRGIDLLRNLRKIKNKKTHGKLELVYPNGQLGYSAYYNNGCIIGEENIWNLEGKLVQKSHYEDGDLDGGDTIYYPDGNLYNKSTYKGGFLDGISETWYLNGDKESTVYFKKNEYHGKLIRFDKFKNIYFESSYNSGIPVDTMRLWFTKDTSKSFVRNKLTHTEDKIPSDSLIKWQSEHKKNRETVYDKNGYILSRKVWNLAGQLQEIEEYDSFSKFVYTSRFNLDGDKSYFSITYPKKYRSFEYRYIYEENIFGDTKNGKILRKSYFGENGRKKKIVEITDGKEKVLLDIENGINNLN